MKHYPTKQAAAHGPELDKKKRSGPAIVERRTSPPEIFVKCMDRDHSWRDSYARAHLRNRNGYVYLNWRDGNKVRSFYLGKAPRKCPTPDPELRHLAPAPASSPAIAPRRVKKP